MISSNASVVARRLRTALRTRHEHTTLLPTGPQPELDRDRARLRADLSVAPRSPDLSGLEPRVLARSRHLEQRVA